MLRSLLVNAAYVRGEEPLGSLSDLEDHAIAGRQRSESFGLNLRVVNEDVLTTVRRDESEPLHGIEPLDGTFLHGVGG